MAKDHYHEYNGKRYYSQELDKIIKFYLENQDEEAEEDKISSTSIFGKYSAPLLGVMLAGSYLNLRSKSKDAKFKAEYYNNEQELNRMRAQLLNPQLRNQYRVAQPPRNFNNQRNVYEGFQDN